MQNIHTTPSARSPKLQQLSCITCRRRKVRCNRRDPCFNCVKAGIACVFPEPVRNSRKIRESSRTDLGHRLNRLEDLVQGLQNPTYSDSGTVRSITTSFQECPYLDTDPREAPQKQGSPEEFGRLAVDHGCGRYISNRLWASVCDQVGILSMFPLFLIVVNSSRLTSCVRYWSRRIIVLVNIYLRAVTNKVMITTTTASSSGLTPLHTRSQIIIRQRDSYRSCGRNMCRMSHH